MARNSILALVGLAVICVLCCAEAQNTRLWPLPQTFTTGATVVSVRSPFVISSTSSSSVIKFGIERYQALMFPHMTSKSFQPGDLVELDINVINPDETLQLETSESYQLQIPAGGKATLVADTVYGALRGLETFSQLVYFNFTSHTYAMQGAPWSIKDFPRFPHRGLLVDTARHYQPLPNLFKMIDSLAFAKLNVLHWHAVDTQSFPIESRSYPLLWTGAYSDAERYTTEDMMAVVEYARLRGVRVMIEFDMPGHAESWCVGYPGICLEQFCTTPLDPSTNATFDLIDGLLTELTSGIRGKGMFPENLLHLGGDEVNEACWTQTPHVAAWLQTHNFTTDQAYMYFVERAHDIAVSKGRDPVNWEEVFNHFGSQLDKRTIVHVWLDHATLAKVVAAGYRGLLSNNDVWYLDHLATSWQQFYTNEPHDGITDPAQQQLVLGGEVCMWGETVDASDLFSTVWPRAAAAAERLWSARTVADTTAAEGRLLWYRCLLDSRGIDAAPVNNAEARAAPPGPGGCYTQ